MMGSGIRRAARLRAQQIKKQIRRDRAIHRLNRIASLEQVGEGLMKMVKADHTNPLSVEHLKETISVLSRQNAGKSDT